MGHPRQIFLFYKIKRLPRRWQFNHIFEASAPLYLAWLWLRWCFLHSCCYFEVIEFNQKVWILKRNICLTYKWLVYLTVSILLWRNFCALNIFISYLLVYHIFFISYRWLTSGFQQVETMIINLCNVKTDNNFYAVFISMIS